MRTHQRQVDVLARALVAGETDVRDWVAAVTPGGGKSLLPVVAASRLIPGGIVDRVCWIVPRDTLRLQAEEAFADPGWRSALGHAVSIRAAENRRDPCRGLGGYVTTYQSVAADPGLHLSEFRKHRYLLAIDELHHLPAVNDLDALSSVEDETSWSRALLPLLESASVRLLMSGTLQRADGRAILWLPYAAQPRQAKGGRRYRGIEFDAPGWAIVGYSRRQALAERAVIPVTFGAMDGEAEWLPKREGCAPAPTEPVKLSAEPELARFALYSALRTGFAEEMLRNAFDACWRQREKRRARMGTPGSRGARGLGKLLVVASDQVVARRYTETLLSWLPERQGRRIVRMATSDAPGAQEAIAAFRLLAEPVILVTVAMAYEGMDCPEVTHIACLTHIRSRPWLEQMIARATRVDPDGGPWTEQRATVFHPDDLMFRRFRHAIETDQGTRAAISRGSQTDLFDGDADEAGERDWGLGIEPLCSNALTLRFDDVKAGPDFGARVAPVDEADPVAAVVGERPSDAERRLRHRIGQMVAAQVVEDEDNNLVPIGPGGYHAYNAVLKRVTGGRSRSEMGTAELEAALGWLERNRLADHVAVLGDDPQFQWSARRKGAAARRSPGKWMAAMDRLAAGRRDG